MSAKVCVTVDTNASAVVLRLSNSSSVTQYSEPREVILEVYDHVNNKQIERVFVDIYQLEQALKAVRQGR